VSTTHAPIPFADLDLEESVRRGIEDAGFVECTPIQAATLPFALAGRDIAGQAQTGTGKTAAFLIATFNRLTRHTHRRQRPLKPRVLIVAPTRELVVQIHKDAELLGRHCDLTLHAVYGGVDYNKQLQKLKDGVDVLIGTPGRLIDYYKQRAYALDAVEVVVVDEADRMFDMGFIDDIRYMLRKLPPPDRRQSFLYSATLSHRVLELAYEHMNEVERVAISENQVTAENVTQEVYHVGLGEKFSLLLGLLEREKPSRALVFVNTRGGRRVGMRPAGRPRPPGRRARRQHRATQAPQVARKLQARRSSYSRRHRRRLARPAHRAGQPRDQLRPAAGS
jgi:ATP-dependent RNA helicase RhlB